MSDQVTAQGRYSALEKERMPFLERARDCSAYTIPTLIPRDGHNKDSTPPTPFSSLPAKGVTALASKILLTLFPPNTPFFRLSLDREIAVQAEQQQGPSGQSMRQVVEGLMNQAELTASEEIEKSSLRPRLFEAIRHIIVGGNVCIEEGGRNTRIHSLDTYVCRRNGDDELVELIVKECIDPEDLSGEHQTQILKPREAGKKDKDDSLEVYTYCRREGKKWESWQEIDGVKLEGTESSHKLEDFPYTVLRWNRIDKEHYGRSYVEEYLGDIISLEELRKAIVECAAVSARTIFLVNPGGVTQLEDLEEAGNGDYIAGLRDEVQALQTEKFADLRIASDTVANIEQSLSSSFLMVNSIQRQAERVTAEEIRIMASELENVLGGIYSLLAQELQYPLVQRILSRLRREGRVPDLPIDTVNVSIITGLEALGRGQDLQRLDTALFGMPEALQAQALQYLNVTEYLSRRFEALGIDTEGLVKDEATVMEEQNNNRMQQMAEKLGPAAIREAGNAGQLAPAEEPQGAA